MRNHFVHFILGISLVSFSCYPHESHIDHALHFDQEVASYLYQFAFNCIDQQYPNKPGVVLGDETYIKSPKEMHPAFYGCFDWHSAVHGHWTLVTLLKKFPQMEQRQSILAKLKANITQENIQKEIIFFSDEHNKTFQRTYGWAWLLKLAQALKDWEEPAGIELYKYLQPLEQHIALQFIEFLDKLNDPIRVGEHSNISFGMSLAYDYASQYHPELASRIEKKARDYFMNDKACPLTWEPGGFDFISPCLQEASLMLKVLPNDEFEVWFEEFLPGFSEQPDDFLQPAEVTDPSDGKLAHLDGLNFNRAWCLFEIGQALHNDKIIQLGVEHFEYSYAKLDAGEYAGSHWLATFATYALIKNEF